MIQSSMVASHYLVMFGLGDSFTYPKILQEGSRVYVRLFRRWKRKKLERITKNIQVTQKTKHFIHANVSVAFSVHSVLVDCTMSVVYETLFCFLIIL